MMGGVCCGSCCACCTKVKFEAEITSGQLIEQAQTGDVILFSRGGCNCFQQCVTGSVWVHVAMVVVSANGETRYAPLWRDGHAIPA